MPFLFNRTIPATLPVNSTVTEDIIAVDDDLEGDLRFELLGSFPATEYFSIEESGPQIGNTQRLRVYITRSLTTDPLENDIYLVNITVCCRFHKFIEINVLVVLL